MPILHDRNLRYVLPRIRSARPAVLWHELDAVAAYFALIGATSEALSVWRFAYSERVPVPHTNRIWGDVAVSAVCFFLGAHDFSLGRPAAQDVPDSPLEARVVAYEQAARRRLTLDTTPLASDAPELKLMRRAHELIRPLSGVHISPHELEALPLLEEVAQMPEATASLLLQANLLIADIAARHKQEKTARAALKNWHRVLVEHPQAGFTEEVFCLRATTRLICDGALNDISQGNSEQRALLVRELLKDLQDRLDGPQPSRPASGKISRRIDHDSFTVGPSLDYFDDVSPGLEGENYPFTACLKTPHGTGMADFEIAFAAEMPKLTGATYAVGFGLRVIAAPVSQGGAAETPVGNVFVHAPFGGEPDDGFAVPPGEYDVVARFFPRQPPKRENPELSAWRVVLTFLPRGKAQRGVLLN